MHVNYFFCLTQYSEKNKIQNMKKQESFKKAIKKNRKHLLSQGFLPSTLTMWSTGQRIPRKPQAVKIAGALGIPLARVPYRTFTIK